MIKQFTVSVLVFDHLNASPKILLIHHKKFNKWMIPGGHVDHPFEAAHETGIREVYEETGIEISLFSFLHKRLEVSDAEWVISPEYTYEQIIPKQKFQPSHIHVDFAFLGMKKSGEIKANKREVKSVEWVDINQIDSLDMFHGTTTIIKDAYEKIKQKYNSYN